MRDFWRDLSEKEIRKNGGEVLGRYVERQFEFQRFFWLSLLLPYIHITLPPKCGKAVLLRFSGRFMSEFLGFLFFFFRLGDLFYQSIFFGSVFFSFPN